ncbi:Hypp1158 [Branchiostoma lanceolatum]|uniref:Hypp1158 protein n=1 Tax=Branchiostoma lanceolatum TaxID=7740 RepID=A0A8J9ZHG8_BRALA|nr:Hypp1158 [Branchiostoma lanceolatum]
MLTPCTFAPREVTKRRRRDPPANEPNVDRMNDTRSDNEGSDDDGDDQEIPVLLVTEPVEPVNVPIEPIMNEQVDNQNLVRPEPVEVLPDDEDRNRYPIRANRGVPPDRYGNWQMKIEASPTVTAKSLRQRARGFLRSALQTLEDKIDSGDENEYISVNMQISRQRLADHLQQGLLQQKCSAPADHPNGPRATRYRKDHRKFEACVQYEDGTWDEFTRANKLGTVSWATRTNHETKRR